MIKFEEFHRCFKGDTYDLCVGCRACEDSSIATLLWGEKEFISKPMNMPLHIFEEKYLDRLVTPLGYVDVLKFDVCSFLDQEKR